MSHCAVLAEGEPSGPHSDFDLRGCGSVSCSVGVRYAGDSGQCRSPRPNPNRRRLDRHPARTGIHPRESKGKRCAHLRAKGG